MNTAFYRPEIDGLRAVAVLPVILFHAGLPGFHGGYTGVDIFFVISGFLITQIILRERDAGSFTFRGFYERRARRLMPALLLVILVSVPFGAAWMTPQQFWDYGQSIGYTVFFVANIGLEGEAGYFAQRADVFPFLHTWSLSVEEQFYLIFPSLLLLALRLSWAIRLAGFAALFAVSLVLSEIRAETAPAANFYFLTTRAWELLAGAILAMVLHRHPDRPARGGLGAEALAALGGALILAGFIVIDSETPFPSRWTLLPVLGTVLLLFGAGPGTLVGRFLSLRPVVLVGLISYPAYLWHQPLFAFARIRTLGELPVRAYLALSLLALVLAWVTWRFVEIPVRQRGVLSRGQVFAGTAAFAMGIGILGVAIDQSEGWPGRFSPRVAELMAWADDLPPRREECHSKPGRVIPPAEACIQGTPDAPGRVALWGDSHAMVLTEQMGAALRPYGSGLVDFTYRACSPLIGYEGPTVDAACAAYNAEVLDRLERDGTIEVVVVHARWPLLVEALPFDNTEGGIEGGRTSVEAGIGAAHGRSREAQVDLVTEALETTVSRLRAAGREVVLLGGVPEAGWNLPDYMARRVIFGLPDGEASYPRAAWDARNAGANAILADVAERTGAVLIDPTEAICGTGPRCRLTRGGVPLYSDDDHLNSLGAARVAGAVTMAMETEGLIAR